MLIDADLANLASLHARVLIVGAGPAGITLALELERRGIDVVLLESGKLRFDPAIQKLGDAVLQGSTHAPMQLASRRQVGGASNIWGGRCVPYDPVDFDVRPFVPDSVWPVSYAQIAAYFQRACDYFRIGEGIFDLHQIPNAKQKSIVPGLPDGDVISSSLERWSLPTNFGKEYARELRDAKHVRLVVGLTCTEIVCSARGDRVEHVVAKTMDGRAVTLQAERYVIACGGVETTRLLLASNRVHPTGIGNHSDHLGRWYMGHISGRIARVRFTTPPRQTVYGFDRDPAGIYLRRRFTLSRELQHAQRLTNICSWLVNPTIGDPSHGNGVLSFAYLALTAPVIGARFASEALRKAATAGAPDGAWLKHVLNVLRDLPRTALFALTFGYKRFIVRRKVPGFFQYSASNEYPLHYHGEQVPRRDSTVRLSDERDALGLRRAVVDLRFDPMDVESVIRAHEHWDRWLRRHAVGELVYTEADLRQSVWEQAGDGYHQAGTTRMSARPSDGVVDANCAIHGVDNLFIASSSVFPSSGQANSTFMIVAFALRLADHLAATLQTAASDVSTSHPRKSRTEVEGSVTSIV